MERLEQAGDRVVAEERGEQISHRWEIRSGVGRSRRDVVVGEPCEQRLWQRAGEPRDHE